MQAHLLDHLFCEGCVEEFLFLLEYLCLPRQGTKSVWHGGRPLVLLQVICYEEESPQPNVHSLGMKVAPVTLRDGEQLQDDLLHGKVQSFLQR